MNNISVFTFQLKLKTTKLRTPFHRESLHSDCSGTERAHKPAAPIYCKRRRYLYPINPSFRLNGKFGKLEHRKPLSGRLFFRGLIPTDRAEKTIYRFRRLTLVTRSCLSVAPINLR